EPGDWIIELDLALVEQNHEGGSGPDDFSERCEVVQTLARIDGFALLGPAQAAEAPLPYESALATDDDSGARVAACLNPAHDHMVDLREPCRRHPDGTGCLNRQPIATTSGDSERREQQSKQ